MRTSRLIGGLLVLVLLTACAHAADKAADEKLPVILLTGFEPFGEGRPPNPSWEGVKRLDGETWRGHRLVGKQLPVVWGAPHEHLKKWIDEYQPVAIFSFGQGGGYKLETRAMNRRDDYPDNKGAKPSQLEIVADGPATFDATIDSEALVKQLAERGHRVAISQSAGSYLCEECLYTLEYLKAKEGFKGPVLFCHIPKLSSSYSPEDAEKFMRAVLESWHAIEASAAKE